MPTRRAPDRELILARHEFPGSYVIKAFGPAEDRFRAGVAAAVAHVPTATSERATASGRRICITLVLEAHNVDDVIDAYERLGALDSLLLIL